MGEYSEGCAMDAVMVQFRVMGFQRSQVSVLWAFGLWPPPHTSKPPSERRANPGYQRCWFKDGWMDHCPVKVLKLFTRVVASRKSGDCCPPTKSSSPVPSSVSPTQPCGSCESAGKVLTRETGSKRTGSWVSWQKSTVPSARREPELLAPNVSGEVSPIVSQAPGCVSGASVKLRCRGLGPSVIETSWYSKSRAAAPRR